MTKTETVGERINRLRESKELYQWQLAKRVGIQQATLCQIEKGRHYPTIWTAHDIAKALGVSLDYLVTGEESE